MNVKLKKLLIFILCVCLVIESIIIFRHINNDENPKRRYIDVYYEFEKRESSNSMREIRQTTDIPHKENKHKIYLPTTTILSRLPPHSTKEKTITKKPYITNKDNSDRLKISNKISGKVNVFLYDNICFDLDPKNMFWNALFPSHPANASMMSSLKDETLIAISTARRITGFISPIQTDYYEFEISSRSGCEFMLIENYNQIYGVSIDKFLLRFGLHKDEIIRDDSKLKPLELFKKRSNKTVLLTQGRKYLFDLTHAVQIYGRFEIKWKTIKEEHFHSIPSKVLSPLEILPNVNPRLPNIQYLETSRQTQLLQTNTKNYFYIRIQLNENLTMEECDYTPSYIPDKVAEGHGVGYVRLDLLYPRDEMIETHIPGGPELWIDNHTALNVVQSHLTLLSRNYTIDSIVQIEENKEDKHGKRYFVELDLKHKTQPYIYRSSEWIFFKNNGELCKPKGYQWEPHEKIYLLTPVKNQRRWIQYLIESINHIVKVTGEKQIHLIMVDFNSTDAILENILKEANFPYTLLKRPGKFCKVRGLNVAVKSISEEDALMFIMDLHLQIPLFIFDYIRKHTFKSKTTYCPILLRLYCGEHPEYTERSKNSIWQEIGYGMISIFKSDWNKIGGMDEEKFGGKWGGEDWDLVERIIKNKIEVIHHRIPGYYHLYHSTKGTWDGTKLF